jgi:hypothetical protein
MMAKQLLTPLQAAKRLGICRAKFYVLRPKLVAKGLKGTRVGKNMKYLESSLEELIDKAIRTGQPLV